MWFSVITILLLCLAKNNNREYIWIWFTCNYSSLVNDFYICHKKVDNFIFSYDRNCSLALFLKKKFRTALLYWFSICSISSPMDLFFSRASPFCLWLFSCFSVCPLSFSNLYFLFSLICHVTDFYYWILLPLSDPQEPLKVFYSLIKFDNN